MATNREEIIEDFQEHMRKTGGAAGEWLIGTANDARSPFFRNHLVADIDDGLIYREAFTTTSAEAICDHFTNDGGLMLDVEDVPAPGKIVFIYRRAERLRGGVNPPLRAVDPAPAPPPTQHPVFRKHAA